MTNKVIPGAVRSWRSLFGTRCSVLLGALLGLAAENASAQDLAHRWSFNDPNDSVGGANVTLNGTASITGGKLVLAGGGVRTNHAAVPIGPTLAANNSLTVETWFTIATATQTWSKLWMFGNSAATARYLDFTPFSGVADNPPSMSIKPSGAEVNTRGGANPPALATGTQILSTVVYDDAADEIRFYLDGVLADSEIWVGKVSDVGNTPENFIGAAVFYGDTDWAGSVDELRIWKGAMGPEQAMANFNAGPDTIATHDPKLSIAQSVTDVSDGSAITIDIPVTNNGTATSLSINSAMFSGLDDFFFTVTTSLPLTIGVGQTANISVDFDPSGNDGFFESNLVLESNDSFNSQILTSVSVNVAGPEIGVLTSVVYGPVADTAGVTTYQLAIENTGPGDLEIFDAYFDDGDVTPTHFQRFGIPFDFNNDGPLVIPSNTTSNLDITFDPSALAAGLKKGMLHLATNDFDEFDVAVDVGVNVTAPAESGLPVLKHRWSFSDQTDSVGDADVELIGTASVTGGNLVLPGGGVRTNHAQVAIGDTIAEATSLTVEAWFTATTPNQTWSKVWMFGTAVPAEAQSSFMDFTPISDLGEIDPPSMSFRHPGYGSNTRAAPNPEVMVDSVEYHVVCVYDANADLMSLYIDGSLADSAEWTSEVNQLGITTENYIGAAVFYGDNDWTGTVNEMRIWRGAFQAGDVSASFAAGTETVPEPGALPIRITGVEVTGGNLVITGTEGLVNGESYHLQTGTTLADFVAVAGSTFTGGGAIPTVPVAGPKRFIRIVDGVEP